MAECGSSQSRSGASQAHLGAKLAVGLLPLLLAGCALFGPAGSDRAADDDADEVSAGEYDRTEVLRLLAEGEVEPAEALLRARLNAEPEDRQAAALLKQIEVDPEKWLGRDHFDYVVKPGESLSQLAGRFLEQSDRFFILARYNDIAEPADLQSGQRLRIPTRFADESAQREEEDTASGQGATGRDAASGNGAEEGATGDAEDSGDAAAESEDTAEAAYQEAIAALDEERREAASQHLAAALERDPDHEAAQREQRRLRDKVAPKMHRRAVLHYRNQELDAAIELWDEVLTIDPDFDRARGYRSRAVELQERLEEVEE